MKLFVHNAIGGLGLVLGLLGSARPAQAQEPITTATPAYRYITLYGHGTSWQLEYGQYSKAQAAIPAAEAAELVREAAAVKQLFSETLALTYLSSHGWEYVSTATDVSGSSTSTGGYITVSSYIQYLLRRRMP